MMYPNRPTADIAVNSTSRNTRNHSNSDLARRIQNSAFKRQVNIQWMSPQGEIKDFATTAPALPFFEEAFGAFSRGALISTQNGPVAVDDLLPGDMIEVGTGGYEPLEWIGSMTLLPADAAPAGNVEKLYRITGDSLGPNRPMRDLLLGPYARLPYRHSGIGALTGANSALAPITFLADGHATIEVTPISPVRVYHLVLKQHSIIQANGLEVETYHPGANSDRHLTMGLGDTFMALFPHMKRISDFGRLAMPRLSDYDLDQITAA